MSLTRNINIDPGFRDYRRHHSLPAMSIVAPSGMTGSHRGQMKSLSDNETTQEARFT
jgi:hypothetical protein